MSDFTTCEVPSLPYEAPSGYYYEAEEFKRNVVRIWLCSTRKFDYNNGAATRTIHSFYNTKTKEYFSPINSKTIGSRVNIKDTRSWTSMPIKQSVLEQFFV
jgi:hypothetical protein